MNAGLLNDSEGVAQFHSGPCKEQTLTLHFKVCETIIALPSLPDTYVQHVAGLAHIQSTKLLLEGICVAYF
jgi:hypothetical protein